MSPYLVSRRPYLLIVMIVAASICLAACGSSSKSSSAASSPGPTSSAPATATSSAAAVAGTPIRIGTICSCSGPQAAALGSSGVGIAAWAASVNRAGGINGHPVHLYAMDDGGNPATSLQDVKELVADKVVAIVSDFSYVDTTWASYIADQHIPVIGGLVIETPFLSNPDFYADGTSNPVEYVGFSKILQQIGEPKLRILYCAESPICALAPQIATLGAAATGVKLTISSAKISSVAPSYAAPCLSAKGAAVQALSVGANAVVVPKVADACSQQGYKPTMLAIGQSGSPRAWTGDPAFDNAVIVSSFASDADSSLPAVAAYRQGLNSYKPGYTSTPAYNGNALAAWASGKLFQAAAKAAKLTPGSTPADVIRGLDSLKKETLGGLTAPLAYTAGQPLLVPCWFEQRIEHGAYVSQNAGKPSCASKATLQVLGAALKKLG